MKAAAQKRISGRFALILALIFLVMGSSAYSQKLRSMKYSTRSARLAENWQKEVRAKLATLLNINDLLANGRDIPLNPAEIRMENKGDYLLKEIEINSTANRRIRVIVTFPLLTNGPWPAVICIHGHGGKPLSVYEMESPYKAFATALAARNYVTVAPVVSQHEIYEEGRTLMGERLWDAMRCIDFLESLISVDATRIGCAGLSLGGEMAMWLGAMDQRIKATVSSGFLTRMDQLEQGHCMCWKFPGLRELVDFADIYSLIAPRQLLCQNGLKEPPTDFTVELAKVALKEIQVIYTNYSKPDNVALAVHPEGHVVDVPGLLYFFKRQFNPVKSAAYEE
jgi:dienelactone hydrolase